MLASTHDSSAFARCSQRLKVWIGQGIACVATIGCLSCGASNEEKAVAATAVMVVMTGANRVLTKECWAACTPGYVCNHESGLCEPGECSPACLDDQVCARVQQQLICIDKGSTFKTNVKGQTRQMPVGGPPSGLTDPPVASASQQPISVVRATACPEPGSDAWYATASPERGASEHEGAESTQAGNAAESANMTGPDAANLDPTPLVGTPEHDFVGVWRQVLPAPKKAASTPRPLIVTDSWYGYTEDTAQDYERLSTSDAQLSIRVSPRSGAAARNIAVQFLSRDRIQLEHGEYVRADCQGADYDTACCALPRARWVRLSPVR